jgi:serine/threonine-protein kinase
MQPRSQDISSATEAPFPRYFGPHVLINRLGEGGMGRVYLALERTKQGTRLCVIKKFGNPHAFLVTFTPAQIEENKERFRREAEISMALSHPSIARTFSSVQDGARSYLVQEFVRGMTLEFVMSRANMPGDHFTVPLAAYIVAQLAGALDYVHSFRGVGLIHRDLSGSNVMFTNDGEVKIIDFGIAKTTLLDDGLTRPNVVVGKQLWTAPEVVAGANPDHRTDLYALGLLFWYLLTSKDPTSRLASSGELPPPSSVVAECPTEVDAIVRKAADPRPDRRYQSAGELLAAVTPLIPAGYRGKDALAEQMVRYRSPFSEKCLDEFIAEARVFMESTTPKAPWIARHKRLALALGALAVLVALGVSLSLHHVRPGQERIPVAPPPPPRSVEQPSAAIQPAPTAKAAKAPAAAQGATTRPSASAAPTVQKTASAPANPAHETAPRLSVREQSADELLASAQDAFDRSNVSRALSLARLAAERGAGAEAFVLIGGCLVVKKDYAGTQEALEHALRLSPDNAEAKRGLEKLRRRAVEDTP